MTAIPTVDLALPRERIVGDFLAAYGEVGFAYLVGHGIDDALVADVFAASAEFHALPLADRMRIALDANHRGFIPIDTSTDRTSTLAEVKRPNQSESFMMMRDSEPGEYLAGRNQWPDLPGFRDRVERYQVGGSNADRMAPATSPSARCDVAVAALPAAARLGPRRPLRVGPALATRSTTSAS